jgi:signal peptide peptidase SppA
MSALLDYVTGCGWLLHQPVLDGLHAVLVRHLNGVRLDAAEVAAVTGSAESPPADDGQRTAGRQALRRQGSLAILPIEGVLARYAHEVNGSSQPRGRSYESIRADLKTAAADPSVRGIVLLMNSPGGTASGCDETAELIRRIDAATKPVYAHADGLMASAAYYLASQCRGITAGDCSLVGSIGVVATMYDLSARAEREGVRLHVLRSGPHKATGQPGEALTAEALAPLQSMVDGLASVFRERVAAGRGLTGSALAAVSDGRVFLAREALSLELIDRILPADDLLDDLAATLSPIIPGPARLQPDLPACIAKDSTMDHQDHQDLAAILKAHPAQAALIADCLAEGITGPDLQARLAAAEQQATLAAAQAATVAALQERDALADQLAAAQAEAAHLRSERDTLQAAADQTQAWRSDLQATADAGADAGAEASADQADEALQARWRQLSPAQQSEWMTYDTWAYAQLHPQACGLDR